MLDAMTPAIVTVVLLLALLGLFAVIVQVRLAYKKWKADRDIDRVIYGRHRR